MAYFGYVVEVKELRPHTNADRLQVATFFGSDVCVGLDVKIGDIGIYFPTDGQLSQEFCEYNNLVRKKDENGNNIGGYMDPDKRNVKAIKLRGEKSDGIYLDIKCLDYLEHNLKVGDTVSKIGDFTICQKYIPRGKHSNIRLGNKSRKKKVNIAPDFKEHADTEQLAYNLDQFKDNDLLDVTLKMHGTSQRTGYLPVLQGYNDSYPCKVGNAFRKMFAKLADKDYEPKHDGEPIYEYDYVCGTRRVVIDSFDGGFYGSNAFREVHHNRFKGKLWQGETVYYEVVGFTQDGNPIMSEGTNSKVDKEFVKQYGDKTIFSYGCEPDGNDEGIVVDGQAPKSKLYVYRMTMTTPDGNVIEYTPDFMRLRCEQMGIDTVPHFRTLILDPDDTAWGYDGDLQHRVLSLAEAYYDGRDPVGKTHVREGVVIRVVNRLRFTAFKHKNHDFKVLEGIIKESADAPDMEEAQEVAE